MWHHCNGKTPSGWCKNEHHWQTLHLNFIGFTFLTYWMLEHVSFGVRFTCNYPFRFVHDYHFLKTDLLNIGYKFINSSYRFISWFHWGWLGVVWPRNIFTMIVLGLRLHTVVFRWLRSIPIYDLIQVDWHYQVILILVIRGLLLQTWLNLIRCNLSLIISQSYLIWCGFSTEVPPWYAVTMF